MAYGTVVADQIQTSVSGVSLGAGNATSFKNRIINGAMTFSQRNGTTSTSATDSTYNLDRWKIRCGTNSKFTTQQVTTAPAGFNNSTLITSSANTSLGATDYYFIAQLIEGFNTADLGFGTANAKTITVSFWVQASITGTFGGALQNGNGTRSYPFGYTISVANTWQQVTATIPGDTSGTWTGASTSVGLELRLNIASGSSLLGTANVWASADYEGPTGSTNLLATSGNTMNITGVQLEVGSVATGFDYRSYGTELALCQRYYLNFAQSSSQSIWTTVYNTSGNNVPILFAYPVTMRANPTLTNVGTWATGGTSSSSPVGSFAGVQTCTLYWQTNTTGNIYIYNQANNGFTASAEL